MSRFQSGNQLEVKSENVQYSPEHITAQYNYGVNHAKLDNGKVTVVPKSHRYTFRTQRKVPRVGMMLVGWGGNNGSTVTAGIIANKKNITWRTKEGVRKPNYWGSVTQTSTVRVGTANDGSLVYVPLNSVLPMVHPNDLVVGGWDINGANIADAMVRAEVLDWDLQRQLIPEMKSMKPLPSIYYPDFIAANQKDRANNLVPEGTRKQHLEHIRRDIREFKAKNKLDKVIVLWTANTERFTDVRVGLNDTADNVMKSIERNDSEISPSNIFAVASLLEGCPYINGSPQNTLVPGIIELAERLGVFVGGDDFKSGQTKMKSVLADFLVSAGLKLQSIVSYNHLGNNDGFNLSAPQQFRSKEISKSSVVDDMVESNRILYETKDDKPDHCIVIKYIPFVKDSKRAMDEYVSSIFLHGSNTISIHNVCEDSLLASPLILDLVILAELFTRIEYKTVDMKDFARFDAVLSVLSYLLKAPVVSPGKPVINSLFRQYRSITNILSACVGLHPDDDMLLEHKTKFVSKL